MKTLKERLAIHRQIEQENRDHLQEFRHYSGRTVRDVLEEISQTEPEARVRIGSEYGTQDIGKAKNAAFNLYAAGRWAIVKRVKRDRQGRYEIITGIGKTPEETLLEREGVPLWAYI